MTQPKLAPHEADLVEADAAAMYEVMRVTHRPYLLPWPRASEEFRAVFLQRAANPYDVGPPP